MVHAIVPVKSLDQAKSRLAALLSADERRRLVLAMLDDVLAALGGARLVQGVSVVSRDPAVLRQAAAMGALALDDQAADLNGSIAQAAAGLPAAHAGGVLVLPADVPLVTPADIDALVAAAGGPPGVALAPSADGGTNGLVVRPPQAIPFLFGEGSRARHTLAAQSRGIAVQTLVNARFARDVDRPDDLLALLDVTGARATGALVQGWNIAARLECV